MGNHQMHPRKHPGTPARVAAIALCTLLFLAVHLSVASAAAPELLWRSPEVGNAGSGAGEVLRPGGIGVDASSGHLFVADRGNARIDEFDVYGQFVKAWGWGVVASGPDDKAPVNERQEVSLAASAGTYRLRYFNAYGGFNADGGGKENQQVTAAIPFNATAASVQAALEGLESLETGDVTVSGPDGGPYTIEFTGAYADRNIPTMLITESALTGSATTATLRDGGSFEVCVPAAGDVCEAGQGGSSLPGELPSPEGVAVDGAGDVYVDEIDFAGGGNGQEESFRVQKFSSAGALEWIAGGEVNKTKSAESGSSEAERNLCSEAELEGADVCGTGVPGSGNGQFAATSIQGNRIAIGPGGDVFVGDMGRIQEFEPDGAYKATIEGGALSGETVQSLAMDAAGNFYVTFGTIFGSEDNVHKLSPAGAELAKFPVKRPSAVAVAAGSGNIYAVSSPGGLEQARVLEFGPSGSQLIPTKGEEEREEHFAEAVGDPLHLGQLGSLATSSACGIAGEDLYVSDQTSGFLRGFGPAPQNLEECPVPARAPTITDQFATSAGADGAVVEARINPHFWPDATYYVEYGTGKCRQGGCRQAQPAPPGADLSARVVNASLPTAGVFLSGLSPKTTYHYRFVAESEGGGPVYGLDPDGEGPEEAGLEAGLEGTFETTGPRPAPPNPDPCPNARFRGGASASLPDCRAYEMVSPVDKDNGDIAVLKTVGKGEPASLDQSSVDGERLAYSSYRSFGDAQSAPFTSQYIASRGEDGWSSHGISPPRGEGLWEPGAEVVTQFKAFSPDLCSALLVQEADPPLAPGAVPGFANVYKRDNCGPGADGYEALTTVEPPNREPQEYRPEVQGVAADGGQVIFGAPDRLDGGADLGVVKPLLYESSGAGDPQLVCVLPSGRAVSTGCTAGTNPGSGVEDTGRNFQVSHAISDDGSRIFWSDAPTGEGKIYVRIDGEETLPVSQGGETLSGHSGAQYLTAAADGSRAIFSVGERAEGNADLYEFDVDSEETTPIAGEVFGLLGASEDARRIYLVSAEALAAGAVAGQPNLYLYEAGEGGGFSFIGALARADLDFHGSFIPQLSPISLSPQRHVAQVSPDGLHATFMSTARLTGYDNTDAASGEADAEVYLYGAGAEGLHCVSCNPTRTRPQGRELGGLASLWAAAQIATSQTQLYPVPRLLSSDGGRLFFESFEALVPADTNGKEDVYEWEAPGEGPPTARCGNESASFDEEAGGCVNLISSGEGEGDSSLVDASRDGSDVFFATAASLLPQDPGLIDIYDARVEGGFPPEPGRPVACEGEACQSPPSPPDDPTPASSAFAGAGNVTEGGSPACRKGKVRRKGRCVKRQKHAKHARHHKAKHPHHNRRAAR